MKIWHFPALAGALAVGACGGFSSMGGEEGGAGGESGDETGGTSGAGMGKGGRGGTGGTSGTMGMSGTAGASAGTGGGVDLCAGRPCGAACACAANMGEPSMGACDLAVGYCDANGECNAAFPVCENGCETAMDCGVIDAPCQNCPDGSTRCPSVECLMGQCVSTYPSCAVECMSDAGCPVVAAPCQMCPDGTASCPKAECVNGRCTTGWPGCGGDDPCSGHACGEQCSPCEGMDCAAPGLMFVCNVDGKCAAEAPQCPGTQCMGNEECAALDICGMCVGVSECVAQSCVNGNCQTVCPPVQPECDSTMDCPILEVCRYCPDMTCAQPACIDHECKTVCDLF